MVDVKPVSFDFEAYHQRREKFLDAQVAFKSGDAKAGIIALNFLQQMFYILPAGRIFKKDSTKAMAFVNEIDALRKRIFQYIKKKGQLPTYLGLADFDELDDAFDAVVQKYYEILFDVGLTP